MDNQVVICLSDDDEHNYATGTDSNEKESVAADIGTGSNDPDDQGDEVEEIDAPAIQPAFASDDSQLNDDDLQFVGFTNCTILPHNRQDCIHPGSRFVTEDKPDRSDNSKFCKLCYCYVCDKPARECEAWYLGERGECVDDDAVRNSQNDVNQTGLEKMFSSDRETTVSVKSFKATSADISSTTTRELTVFSAAGDGSIASQNASASPDDNHQQAYKNHCQATDRGPTKQLWYSMRRAIKDTRELSTLSSSSAKRSPDLRAETMHQYHENYYTNMHSTVQQSHEIRRRSNLSTRNRRRVRPRNGRLRPDHHQQRIRAQAMLEELYR